MKKSKIRKDDFGYVIRDKNWYIERLKERKKLSSYKDWCGGWKPDYEDWCKSIDETIKIVGETDDKYFVDE